MLLGKANANSNQILVNTELITWKKTLWYN